MTAGPGAPKACRLDALYVRAWGGVVRQLVLLTGDIAEAEDVIQEAFERAWLCWSTVRDTGSPVAAGAELVGGLRAPRTGTSRAGMGADHVALMTAPQAQRVAVVLHHLAALPGVQVAAETGASGAVKQPLFRGRGALSRLFGEDGSRPALSDLSARITSVITTSGEACRLVRSAPDLTVD